ncbi:MAG: AAA family ATPase [Deltaproteobacteria bacterium]|nr:AAA family ATPase [Deltaproteobacteria bacterium]
MNTAPEYQGMRWFKCDLHVHTPEDAGHWNDSSIRLLSPRSEEDLQEKARRFLRYCHDLELDCIAVTDHNFSAETDHRKWFLTHVIEQNKTAADSSGRAPLVIFPGFELDIRYHVLCLFEPVKEGKRLQTISDILTNMGMAANDRFINGVSQQPKHHGQCWSLREVLDKVQKEIGGIVIAAHAFSNDGICNDPVNISDFINNPDLYSVEVNSWPLSEKARLILNGSYEQWNRPKPNRQPAPICGSDGKSLENSGVPNNLGCRFTWIKMSRPSIEALRQAFLDPESRISLNPTPPQVTHTQVRTIRIRDNKFLENQAIVLSPHLNCIIGGRGSGKSLLFESLRLGLRGEMTFEGMDERDHVAARQVKRLRGTFRGSTRIELGVVHGGLEDHIVVDGYGQPAHIESRNVDDLPTVFRQLAAIIFSQEEITQLADRQQSLLQFIDSLAADRLEPYRARSLELIDQLKLAHKMEETIRRLDAELNSLKQKEEELARQLAAKAQVQEELKRHRGAQESKRYLDSLVNKSLETENRLLELTEELETEPLPLGSRLDAFPGKRYFQQVEEVVTAAYQGMAEAIRSAARAFRRNVDQALTKHPDWEKAQQAILTAEEQFQQACSEKGLTTLEAEQLRETEIQHRAKQAAVRAKEAEIGVKRKQMPDRDDLLKNLTECWFNETNKRKAILDEMVSSDTMPRTNCRQSILKTSLIFAGDKEAFLKKWKEISPDARSQAGRVWDRESRDGEGGENIGEHLFEAFQSEINNSQTSLMSGNPIQWLERNMGTPTKLPGIVQNHLDAIKNVQQEQAEKWFDLLLTRIPDSADLVLLRSDDTEAGSFQKGDLSTGQKNTAILSLLLARGHGPVLIDQPEDELDSEFLYQELVPMLRKAKIQRQLIIVTHNANLPVNGDAELVYTLEARGGKGTCRAQGGLDRSEVTRAVLDIMEGSKEAFIKRKEKYNF